MTATPRPAGRAEVLNSPARLPIYFAVDGVSTSFPDRSAAAATGARRWLGVGTSDATDSRVAGADAARQALTGADPKLLVVFCSIRQDPAEVLAGINEVAGGVPLIGCSSGGEIAGDGPSVGRVVVTAFGGAGFTVSTSSAIGAGEKPRETGAAVAECAAGIVDEPDSLLMLLTEGLAMDQEAIVTGAYLDRLGAPAAAYSDTAALDEFMRVRPVGVRRRHGEEVRHVGTNCSFEDNSMGSGGEIPEGGVVWPMEGDSDSMITSTVRRGGPAWTR